MAVQESLKTHTARGVLSPVDRACVRFTRAMGHSLQSVAGMNMVTISTARTLTAGMPMPSQDGSPFSEARQFIVEHLAKDVGLDDREDWGAVENLMDLVCERVAARIDALSRLKGGERRFGIVEAAA